MSASPKCITVRFSCRECGLVDVPCAVRERRLDEDVVKYVRDVIGRAVNECHQIRSFGCMAKTMQNLKIPLPKDDDPNPYIGKHTDAVPPIT